MKIELSSIEVQQLMTSLDVTTESALIQKIRSKCTSDINRKIKFVSKQNPYLFEVHMNETAGTAVLGVLSPTSPPVQKLKKQIKKLNPGQLTKQFGLALALKDLKISLLQCFR